MPEPLTTLLVKSSEHPSLQSVVINATDFNPEKHEIIEGALEKPVTPETEKTEDPVDGTVPEVGFTTFVDTMRVTHPDHPNLPYVVINSADFDEAVHGIYQEPEVDEAVEAGKVEGSIEDVETPTTPIEPIPPVTYSNPVETISPPNTPAVITETTETVPPTDDETEGNEGEEERGEEGDSEETKDDQTTPTGRKKRAK
jgi:hypothetical protein